MSTNGRAVTTASNGDGRRADGKFDAGNRFSKGSPVARKMHEHRRALLDATDAETIKSVIRKMGELGAEGDTVAAKIFLEFTCGKPTQYVELSGIDGEALGVGIQQLRTIILAAFGDDPVAQAKIAGALLALTNQPTPPDEPTGDEVPDDRLE